MATDKDLDFTGKTILVTGSGRNIGRAIILEFAARGANVVINARTNEAEARSVEREAQALGARVTHSPAPIGDAAVLMAADGYGTAEVIGRRGSETVVVKTTENAIQLKLDAEVTASELAAAVVREVVRLRSTRKLKH